MKTYKTIIDGKKWRIRYRPNLSGKVSIIYEGFAGTHEIFVPGILLKEFIAQLPMGSEPRTSCTPTRLSTPTRWDVQT